MQMKFSAILFFISIIIVSMFVANISNMIAIDLSEEENQFPKARKERRLNEEYIMRDTFDHLIWFIQISDIHISMFHDLDRISDLKEFCEVTVPSINPSVVLATGDLTDAKQPNNIGSRQYKEEWEQYRNAVNICKSVKNSKWLDIRGNHDNFDVPGLSSERNLFKIYGVQGYKSQSYGWTLDSKDGTSYGFIGLDGCPDQGLRRPFNFIGLIPESELERVKSFSARKTNFTIWFGHYPTSCILSKGSQVREVIGEGDSSIVYLCGHLHTLGGMVPEMYTIQKQGFLELELGDWKDSRMYRVAAIDHGLFSFVDVKHKDWPVVIVTNPKHALLLNPFKEPLHQMLLSSHIRILAFSADGILSVEVKLDNDHWKECSHVEGPLYVSPWIPMLYKTGLHNIHVNVLDKNGKEKIITQPFSLDGTRVNFSLLPRFILMSNATTMFQVLFGLAMIACTLPLCIIRYINVQITWKQKHLPRSKVKFVQNWMRRIWIVANIDRFFFPITIYPIYLSIGPWTFGELIHGHFGMLFVWGTFINGTFLPGGFTYAYGFLQLLLFQGPFILTLGHKLDSRLCRGENRPSRKVHTWLLSTFRSHSLFLILFLSQVALAYGFWLSYGTLALLLSPFRLGPLFFIFWAWQQSNTMSKAKIRCAAKVWFPKDQNEDEHIEEELF